MHSDLNFPNLLITAIHILASQSPIPDEDRIFENPLRNRCAQLRELARFSICVSPLNQTDEYCASQRKASLGGLFRQGGLPALLCSYMDCR